MTILINKVKMFQYNPKTFFGIVKEMQELDNIVFFVSPNDGIIFNIDIGILPKHLRKKISNNKNKKND